ncbi:MAG: NusG domain II-containing protein [Treponema sp.]|jgi:hypothetical protein|nr:NusG domain II-containing protein [Treponema sp.]
MSRLPVKPFDFCVIIPALGLTLAAVFFVYSGAEPEYTINLKGEGGEWIFSRSASETVSVSGPLGVTLVEIRNGAARVVSSPCANQTCIAAGSIRSYGQWAACLPNRVMLYIGGPAGGKTPVSRNAGSEADVDAGVW